MQVMPSCYKSGDFFAYFKENMSDLGLPVPKGVFENLEDATAKIGLMASALATLGRGATVAELVGATVGLEKLLLVGAFSATAYVGAAIGSLAVATGRAFACGTRISDMFVFMHTNDLEFPGWHLFYQQHPEILDPNHPRRKDYMVRARATPNNFEVVA